MSAHTPGPWKLDAGGYITTTPPAAHLAKFPKNKRVTVGHVVAFAEATYDEVNANAQLLAAAPGMLDALQAMFDERAKDTESVVALCRAALDKAEGRS
jgi:hypothetical protein